MALQLVKNHLIAHCNYEFANEVSLKEHEIIHTGEKQFSCTHCNNEFPEEMHLKEHDIYPTYSGNLSADTCKKKFSLNKSD